MNRLISNQIEQLSLYLSPVLRFFTQSAYSRLEGVPDVNDFVLGNPQEIVLPEFVNALQRWSNPQHRHWYAYMDQHRPAQEAIAQSLSDRFGVTFAAEDILPTNGAFAALAAVLRVTVDPGDEVIFLSPPWFFYESMIAAAGATPVRVNLSPPAFDLDVAAVGAAITERTRGIIINSPHNPSGRVYPPEALQALAALLQAQSEANGRTIYLYSDEAYSQIVFDGRTFHTPTLFYPHSFLIYTYGKVLLTPGQRLGYITLPPALPNREIFRQTIYLAQLLTGYAFPNALLQYALPELEELSIDIDHLQQKRDRLVNGLRDAGYEVISPEGTFYVLVRSLWPDDWAFTEYLAEQNVYCLPGTVVELPGYLRFSLTANDEMIERALPLLTAVAEEIG
jgi:aspartate aminotransferase